MWQKEMGWLNWVFPNARCIGVFQGALDGLGEFPAIV